MIKAEWVKVVQKKSIAKNIVEMTLQGQLVAEMSDPGQFVHIKVSKGADPLLRRPISICHIDKDKSQFTIIFRIDGIGTNILAGKDNGETVHVLGPLGNGFNINETLEGETALLVGGGVGVPPLYELSKQLAYKGIKVIHVLGFQSEENIFYESEFERLGETYIATVDGSKGTEGFVTDVIADKNISFNTLYACGPTPMLRALEERYQNKKGFLSLEERMGCGIGACFACVCRLTNDQTGTNYRKVCTDGPVFHIGEVVI